MIRAKQLEALKQGEWLSDDTAKGGGRFTARRLAGGAVCFYFRYTLPDGSRDLLKIGEWSEKGDGNYLLTLEQARARSNRFRERYLAGEKDLRGAIEEQKQQIERDRISALELEAKAEEDKKRRAELSLGGLLTGYVDALKASGKVSADSVEKALYRNIREAFPGLWALPIDDADEDAISPVIDRLTQEGKLREAAKLRSYLRAAFSAAVKSRKAGGSLPLRRFNVRSNPLRDMPTIDGASGVRERALTENELRAYWRRISAEPEPYGALARFHLLSGGQRIVQLARLTLKDIDGDNVILADPKGRRDKPRKHLVPLLPAASKAIELMASPRVGQFIFSTTNGETGASYDQLDRVVKKVVADMVKAGETVEPFTPGDIRRTIETRLAAIGISNETRANLQSHGLSGVQYRHYNVHDYAAEKRNALERLLRLISGSVSSNVANFRPKK